MSKYEVIVSKDATKSLKKIPQKIVNRIIEALDTLETNPIPWREFDVKKIAGMEDFYRIRIGKYRIIYYVDWKNNLVKVLKIEHRKESIYKG